MEDNDQVVMDTSGPDVGPQPMVGNAAIDPVDLTDGRADEAEPETQDTQDTREDPDTQQRDDQEPQGVQKSLSDEQLETLLASGDKSRMVPIGLVDKWRTDARDYRDRARSIESEYESAVRGRDEMTQRLQQYDRWYAEMEPVVAQIQQRNQQLESHAAGLEAQLAYYEKLVAQAEETHQIQIQDPGLKAQIQMQQQVRQIQEQYEQRLSRYERALEDINSGRSGPYAQIRQDLDERDKREQAEAWGREWQGLLGEHPELEAWEEDIKRSWVYSETRGDRVADHARRFLDLSIRAGSPGAKAKAAAQRTPKLAKGGSPVPVGGSDLFKGKPRNLLESEARARARLDSLET